MSFLSTIEKILKCEQCARLLRRPVHVRDQVANGG
jgi:hypothetical protein